MYGKKGSELVKELAGCEPGQLGSYNSNLFDEVIEECDSHFRQLQSLLSKTQEADSNGQTSKNGNHYGALIHHLSLVRNKRCLMAYVYNRAEVIRTLGWIIDQLPEEIYKKLSSSEQDYFKKHYNAIKSYIKDVDVDLFRDMVPPKDPYIKARVLEDIGEVMLSDQTAILASNAILFLRRTDAESYISQGLMEELTD